MNITLISSIFLFYGILSLAYAGVLFQFIEKNKDSSVKFWAFGAFLMGIATIFTIFRTESNLSISYILSNGLAFNAYIFFALGIKQIGGIEHRFKIKILYSLAYLLVYCTALSVLGIFLGETYQTIFVSTLVSLTYVYLAYVCIRVNRIRPNYHIRILAFTAVLSCGCWVLRILFAPFGISVSAFDTNTINSIIFICMFILGIFWYFTFIAFLYSQASKAEQEALTRFEGMATTLPCALYEFVLFPDYSSQFTYISPSIKDIVGHNAESIMADSSLIIEQIHPDDQEHFWKINLESYYSGKTFLIETRLIVADGSVKWIQVSSSPRGEDFKNVPWSGYIIDITNRKQFEMKAKTVDSLTLLNDETTRLLKEKEQLVISLLKANKTSVTGALAASIAHELNQPIGASNLNIQFLQKKLNQNELDPDLISKVLALLARDNHRASTIIQSLRSIFLETHSVNALIHFDDVLQSVLSIIMPEVNKNEISIIIDVEPMIQVSMNEVELNQILLNLLTNAIRELSNSDIKHKEILIKGSQTSTTNMTNISISDSGRGINADRHHNLFELLSNEKNIGMGIGLWLCKYIVTKNDGKIIYEKSELGGAKFTLTIPNKKLTLFRTNNP
jgi:PAS domain S-box-containing protein